MTEHTITLETLQSQSLEALLRQVAEHHVTLTVLLPDGKAVFIGPKPSLTPLPVLEGQAPAGGKEALYGPE